MKIGLVLGSGAARGWAHIGIIDALAERGIVPDFVAGCSVGALVGAAYASGNIDALRQWVLALDQWDIASFFEVKLGGGGVVDVERLREALAQHMVPGHSRIEEQPIPFAAVSTELASGREVWMQDGSLLDAVSASIALPGLFPPFWDGERWLADGGLVNPVPVSLARAMGADVVIAVQLSGGMVGRYLRQNGDRTGVVEKWKQAVNHSGLVDNLPESLKERTQQLLRPEPNPRPSTPAMVHTVASAVSIMQDRITRSRMGGDPPDLVLSPRLSAIGLLEFHRAAECIQEGRDCVERMAAELDAVLGR